MKETEGGKKREGDMEGGDIGGNGREMRGKKGSEKKEERQKSV